MPDLVAQRLQRVLEARGAAVERLGADEAIVTFKGRRFQVSLDNLRRRVQGGEPIQATVEAFADVIAMPADGIEVAGQPEGFRLMLEQLEVAGESALVRPISRTIGTVLVWTDPSESRVQLLTRQVLAGIGEEEAWALAAKHMDELLAKTPLELREIAGITIGMLATGSIFKASLICAPGLHNHVHEPLGWPVLALVPCRDFAYLLPQSATGSLDRFGGVVMREFNESAYPLSPECFSVSDSGIRPIGSFSRS